MPSSCETVINKIDECVNLIKQELLIKKLYPPSLPYLAQRRGVKHPIPYLEPAYAAMLVHNIFHGAGSKPKPFMFGGNKIPIWGMCKRSGESVIYGDTE